VKGWKTAVLLADGRVVSAYDRETEWGPGVENVVAPPVEICVGLNDSASVGEALMFVDWTVLRLGEHLVLMRTGGERGAVIRSPGKRTCERLTSVHAWLCENDEAQRVYDAARDEAWRVYEAARGEAGQVYDVACAEAGQRRDAARDEAQRVYEAAWAEAGQVYAAARTEAGQVYEATVRARVCRKRNQLW